MSEGGEVRGVLVAHGSMAHGLVDALRKISGADEGVVIPVSNDGKSPQAIRDELDQLVGGAPAVVFTDLPSGSCAMAAQLLCRSHPHQVILSGVNLPVLLDFVFNRHLPLNVLIPRLLSRGTESLKSVPEYL